MQLQAKELDHVLDITQPTYSVLRRFVLSYINILLFTEIPLSPPEFPWGSTKAAFTITLSAEGISGFHLLSEVERCYTNNDQLLYLSQLS